MDATLSTAGPEVQPTDVVGDLQRAMGDGGGKLFKVVPAMLRAVIEDRLWAERPDRNGEPFASFEAFVHHRLGWGLESSIDDLLNYCRGEPDVQALIRGEVAAAGPVGANQHTAGVRNTHSMSGEPDTAVRALRRLKRDNPELAAEVIAGRISAHAAAVQAGIRKATWTAPADPERLAAAVEKRFPALRLVPTTDPDAKSAAPEAQIRAAVAALPTKQRARFDALVEVEVQRRVQQELRNRHPELVAELAAERDAYMAKHLAAATMKASMTAILAEDDYRLLLGLLHPDRAPEDRREKFARGFDIVRKLDPYIQAVKA
jgi:hypothetical protein